MSVSILVREAKVGDQGTNSRYENSINQAYALHKLFGCKGHLIAVQSEFSSYLRARELYTLQNQVISPFTQSSINEYKDAVQTEANGAYKSTKARVKKLKTRIFLILLCILFASVYLGYLHSTDMMFGTLFVGFALLLTANSVTREILDDKLKQQDYYWWKQVSVCEYFRNLPPTHIFDLMTKVKGFQEHGTFSVEALTCSESPTDSDLLPAFLVYEYEGQKFHLETIKQF